MNEAFKAVDSLDGRLSYFYFDGNGKQTIIYSAICSSEEFVNYVRKNGGDFKEERIDRSRMINPVLIATW